MVSEKLLKYETPIMRVVQGRILAEACPDIWELLHRRVTDPLERKK